MESAETKSAKTKSPETRSAETECAEKNDAEYTGYGAIQMTEILSFSHVTRQFPAMASGGGKGRQMFTAVDDATFSIKEGEILGLLGESGCGKSTIARMLLGLIHPTSGEIRYRGKETGQLHSREFHPLRREIQMVFQNPFGCLDPRMKVRNLLLEPLQVWKIGRDDADRMDRVRKMCQECGLPESSLEKRPGEFSGGQLQRIAIARTLLMEPKLLVADEIVSALDVAVQNQILQLLLDMRKRYDLTILFITHDLAVIEKMADRVMVMRQGRILQIGDCREVLKTPSDPYVRELKTAGFWML